MSTATPIPSQGFSFPKPLIGPLLITSILLTAHLSFGILDGYHKLLTAVGVSILMETLLHRFTMGEFKNIASAYVSGISAGILIRSPFVWPFALCAAISITSKYVLRYRGRHLWNPTNFGVVMMMLLAPDYAAVLSIQWGNHAWAMIVIWLVGIVTLWKVGRFNITASYIAGFLLFAWVRTLFTGDSYLSEMAPLTGPMYQLFVLFMMTDPKTTLKSRKGQSIVAFLIAFVEMLFRLGEAVYAPFYALFLVGPIALVVEDMMTRRQTRS